jgi:hypothetical protein
VRCIPRSRTIILYVYQFIIMTYLEKMNRLEYGSTGGGSPASLASSSAASAALSASSVAALAAASCSALLLTGMGPYLARSSSSSFSLFSFSYMNTA